MAKVIVFKCNQGLCFRFLLITGNDQLQKA